jgi:penicillin amidase
VTDETALTTRRENIAVRWWPDSSIEVRETPHGPVISDAPLFDDVTVPELALKWTGHQASDEIGAMLAVARAKDFREFRAAFDGFAVPGQNMLYADAAGNVGQVMAVRLPQRDGEQPPDVILAAAERDGAWQAMRGAGDLPFSLNPERGYLVSANNRPAETGLGIGYFFSPDDRIQRMRELIGEGPLSVADIKALQQDVHMPSSVALRDIWLAKLDEAGLGEQRGIAAMRDWDGHYRTDSKGAVAFEQFRDGFTASFYALTFGDTDWQAFANVSRIKTLMLQDIRRTPIERLRGPLEAGLARIAENGDIADWGDMHRLRLSHPLANLPLIGGRYRFTDIAVGGSTVTIMKTAHSTTAQRHAVRYGSNARHVSDMSDMDENYFVLLGGQDGWINSTSFTDQLALWQEGRYLRIPLRRDSLPEAFRHQTTTEP